MDMKRLSYFCFSAIVFFNLVIGYAYSAESVLFLDVNDNPLEINIAKKAALAKGQKIIIYPEGKQKVTTEGLKLIMSQNKFSSMTISGHSGGLEFSGTKGRIDLKEFSEIIKGSSSQEAVQSLYLLGCNSGNKSKIMFWKDSLPNLKFIAGFDGIAPLGHNQLGLNLYADTLKKEENILNSQTVAQFKQSMESIQNIRNFPISLYAKCGEGGGEFLYRPKATDTETFSEFNLEECIANKEKYYKQIKPEIEQYMKAEKEPTLLSPSNGKLKDIYVFARQNEHCFTEIDEDIPDGDSLLHLRFMKDFNVNFSKYYANDFESLEKEIGELINNPIAYEAGKKQQKEKTLELIARAKEDDVLFQTHFGALKNHYAQEMSKLKNNPIYGKCIEADLIDRQGNMSECYNHAKELGQYASLKNRHQTISNKPLFLDILKRFTEKQPEIKEVAVIKNKVGLKEMSATLNKMNKSPNTLTRKEVISLRENLMELKSLVPLENSRRLMDYLNLYAEINSNAYPFSWHEAPGREGIEKPKTERALAGKIQAETKVSPDFAFIASEIPSAFSDE